MSEYVTGFQTKDGIKKYDYNALANLPEIKDVTDTVISPNADYAEVGEWADGNPGKENRLGYFVAIAEVGDNTIKIRKATSTDDVRGVSVYNPAFSGNASKNKYGEDGELLPQYNYIGVMGIVEIIDNGLCTVGGRCMPADDGTAIPSSNNMGYAVLERVDQTHVLIAVEPGADMVQRVKTDVKVLEDQLANGGGMTATQVDMLNQLFDWYKGTNYTPMKLKKFNISPAGKQYDVGNPRNIGFTLTWEFDKTPDIANLTITQTDANGIQTILNESYESQASCEKKNLAFTVSGYGNIKCSIYGKHQEEGRDTPDEPSSSITINFYNRKYFGYAPMPVNVDSTFITTQLGFGEYATGITYSTKAKSPADCYTWYAYPTRYGEATPYSNGAPGGFSLPTIVEVTNQYGFTEKYYVYRSARLGIGLGDGVPISF